MMKPTIAVLALAGSLFSAGEASAHAHLQAETPAADAVVTSAPAALSLDFSEGLEIGLSGIALKAPDGHVVPTGTATLARSGCARSWPMSRSCQAMPQHC
jgi:methionine-rich copper-binding protein CopC